MKLSKEIIRQKSKKSKEIIELFSKKSKEKTASGNEALVICWKKCIITAKSR
jgi:hypothetical protein